jgi:hypothetical protein
MVAPREDPRSVTGSLACGVCRTFFVGDEGADAAGEHCAGHAEIAGHSRWQLDRIQQLICGADLTVRNTVRCPPRSFPAVRRYETESCARARLISSPISPTPQ